jgi:hypothetical protein
LDRWFTRTYVKAVKFQKALGRLLVKTGQKSILKTFDFGVAMMMLLILTSTWTGRQSHFRSITSGSVEPCTWGRHEKKE